MKLSIIFTRDLKESEIIGVNRKLNRLAIFEIDWRSSDELDLIYSGEESIGIIIDNLPTFPTSYKIYTSN